MALPGRFITFEGGEGAGKSTQVRALAHRLLERGIPVRLTREPGGTPGAEVVRRVLLSGAARARGPEAEAVLFAAARSDHVDRVIRPALERGEWVVCDRFIDSTRVYQGAAGVSAEVLRALERLAVDGVVPDLTFILDVPPSVGMKRVVARAGGADRFEGEPIGVHRARRRAFQAIARREADRCVLVDARGPSVPIAERIWQETVRRLDPAHAAHCRRPAAR